MAVTWNPADKGANVTLSNGDLSAEANASNIDSVRATTSKASGKWYWEVLIDAEMAGDSCIGIGTSSASITDRPGQDANGYGYNAGSGEKGNNNVWDLYGNSYTTNDIIGIALDLDNGKVWFAKNNVWQNSGNPAAGTNAAYTGLSGTFFPMYGPANVNGGPDPPDKGTVRFTSTDQTYSPPSGFDPFESSGVQASITEGIGLSGAYATLNPILAEGIGLSGAYATLNPIFVETMSSNDIPLVQVIWNDNILTEGMTTDDAISPQKIWNSCILAEAFSIADAKEVYTIMYPTVSDSLFQWDALKWGWFKSIADSMAIADTASKILGIPISEWISLIDSQVNNWDGVEVITCDLFLLDIPKVVETFDDLIADGMTITDAIGRALELLIADILTLVDSIVDTGVFQHSASETLTLEDIASRWWDKTASDSFVVTDSNTLLYFALPTLTDTITITETTTPGHAILQAISDSLQVLDIATVQQIIQELIIDGLNLEILIELDGELWECWVLNTAAFHPSMYSGYDYNSFAIDNVNNVVYGCKSDGIYELEGATDNGAPFHSGIVLPDTQFGSAHNKRFRKAFLGVSGDNLVLKAETESGSKTFKMTDTEINITRDLKGRSWKFSLEDFDELDFIELVPVILSKR